MVENVYSSAEEVFDKEQSKVQISESDLNSSCDNAVATGNFS